MHFGKWKEKAERTNDFYATKVISSIISLNMTLIVVLRPLSSC